MKCPACGATLKKISGKCAECGASIKKNSDGSLSQVLANENSIPEPTFEIAETVITPAAAAKPAPSLIAFPGVNRNALPEWRKELSERVREKHERKVREALSENKATDTATSEVELPATPILELLPQAEVPEPNPILTAALKRIERANSQGFAHASTAVARATAYDRQIAIADEEIIEEAVTETPLPKTHNLAVVPNPEPADDGRAVTVKPKRLIVESDPALNYLDSIPTALLVERRDFIAANPLRRAVAAILDLSIVLMLSLPLLMMDPLTTINLENWHTLAFSAGSVFIVGFAYLTIATAFTGRTPGMLLCSLRVVDARNGLIPTGGQSAGRALIYLVSLLPAGLLSLYLFIDSERNTIHDRFTHTAVIRA